VSELIDPPQSASDGNQSRDFVITAHRLTSDLVRPRPLLYWTDLLLSSALGYAALVAAILSASWAAKSAFSVLAILALYRAMLFIHELSHLRRGAIPGFRTTWNVLIGIPLLMPTFFRDGVHNHHHARSTPGHAK
jgi:fatty acid desaturase